MQMKGAVGSTDVQHRIYDELHDASNWELFLLSYDLFQLAQGAEFYIYFMAATTETPIFAANINVFARVLPSRNIFLARLPSGALAVASEIPSDLLPTNSEDRP